MSLERWDKLADVPEYAQKKITGGRLRGLTDIKPQWRYQALTKEYGECGVGWKFEIVDLWTEPGSEEQVMCFAKVLLYTLQNNPPDGADKKREWSEPIPGVGGSMLITKESAGLHTSDEGYKMAVTDALSTASKMLGVGASIYMGGNHDSKYEKEGTTNAVKKPKEKPELTTEGYSKMIAAIFTGDWQKVESYLPKYGLTLEQQDNLENAINEAKQLEGE